MTSAFTLKTAPTFEPVSIDDMRNHCRISTNDEDSLLRIYLSAARSWVEAYTQRALCTQTWQLSLSGLPYEIQLPRAAPLQTVTFLKYYDSDNTLTTWNSSNYLLPAFHEPALLMPTQAATIPSLYAREDAVQIEYIAGYATGACPPRLQQADRKSVV